MRNILRRKSGDTLIEVTLAVGIFSMVAVAVVAVMNGGTTSSQTALETTLAREEIDTQAEALRFIQSAYIAEMNADSDEDGASEDERYVELWQTIVGDLAVTDAGSLSAEELSILSGTPDSCANIYNNELFQEHAFIINPKGLNGQAGDDLGAVLITANESAATFQATTTYPRLVFDTSQLNKTDALIDDSTNNQIYRAEGIYIIAVKDSNTTKLVTSGNTAEKTSGFYDFYIKTCWYTGSDETPSSISTVVRLYDPLQASEMERAKVAILRYNDNSNGKASVEGLTGKKLLGGDTATISNVEPNWPGHNFLGWCTSRPSGETCNGATIRYNGDQCTLTVGGTSVNNYNNLITVNGSKICQYTAPTSMTENSYFPLYAIWERIGYEIKYNANGGSYKSGSAEKTQICYYDEPCIIPSAEDEQPRHAYGVFKGWSTSPTATLADAKYSPGNEITPENISLYAVWEKKNGVFAVVAEWTLSADFESNVIGWKSNGQSFTAYYGDVSFSDIDNTPLAILHQDCTSNCYPQNEVFILNTMGGRDYYYYICRYSGSICNSSVSKYDGITVKLYIKDEESGDTYLTIGGNAGNKYDGNYSLVATYSIADAVANTGYGNGYGRYWNVFAFKNGWIVNPGGDYVTTITNNIDQSY